MALPYPNMDFTPLDILTAAEMDKIVANIESLANGTGIADGVIQARKVDFKTFGATNSDWFSSDKTLTSRVELNLPVGKYLLLAKSQFLSGNTGASGECNIETYNKTTDKRLQLQTTWLPSGIYNGADSVAFTIKELDKSSTIQLRTSVNFPERGTYSTPPNHAKLLAIRIG